MTVSFNLTTINPDNGVVPFEKNRFNYPLVEYRIIGVFLLFVGVFGLIENILVLFTFYKSKQLRSATNFFVIGLAICDLCMSALGNPLATSSALHGSWLHGKFFCYWEGFIVYTFGMSELYLLTAISIDRYLVITRPLQSALITKRVAFVSVLGCFGLGVLWSIFPFLGWSSYGLEASGVYCGLLWTDTSLSNTSYVVAITIFCFLLPFGVMIYCYYRIYMTIRHTNKNMVWEMRSSIARRNMKRQQKMLKTCILMCAVYWVVWSPYAVTSFWQTFGDPTTIPLLATLIPAAAAKSNVAWNPIIYVATNKQFRMGFYSSLPCSRLGNILLLREELKERSENYSNNTANSNNVTTVSQYCQDQPTTTNSNAATVRSPMMEKTAFPATFAFDDTGIATVQC